MLVNLPLLGATTFHLFTTFPVEPPLGGALPLACARVPYALAAVVALLTLDRAAARRAAPRCSRSSPTAARCWAPRPASPCWRASGCARGRTPMAARVDVVFWARCCSLRAGARCCSPRGSSCRATFPISLALVWFVVFPASVAYGIARNQLFDIRGLARSSAAYGAATLAITGLFAFLIAFADALFARFNVNASSPCFSVVFLFFAILVVQPAARPPAGARRPRLRPRPRPATATRCARSPRRWSRCSRSTRSSSACRAR